MKHILVAMDLSPHSDRAFERALQLAQSHDAELTVMHVIEEQVLEYGDDSSMEKRLKSHVEEKLRRHWAKIRKAKADRIRLIVKIGNPWEDILAEVKTKKADLIVLGLHHKDALQDMFVGTTAERTIRHSHIPVLVVKDKPAGAYRKAVAATDFSPCSAHALHMGLELAPDAAFTLLHVFDTPFRNRIKFSHKELENYKRPFIEKSQREAKEAMDAFVKGHRTSKASITPMLERNETATGIHAVVDRQNADLLVMGTHGSSGLIGSLIGGYALDFLNAPPCDVLVSR